MNLEKAIGTKFQVGPAPGGVPCRIIRRGNYTPEHRANFRLRSRSGFQPLSFGTKRQGCRFYYPARLSPANQVSSPAACLGRIIRRGNYTLEHRANFRLRSRSGFQPLSLGTKRQGCRFYYPARPAPQTKFQVRINITFGFPGFRLKAVESRRASGQSILQIM